MVIITERPDTNSAIYHERKQQIKQKQSFNAIFCADDYADWNAISTKSCFILMMFSFANYSCERVFNLDNFVH